MVGTNERIAVSTDVARRLGSQFGQRLLAPISNSFTRPVHPGRRTTLARLLGSGRGGEVRLKVYLTLLWLVSAQPEANAAIPVRDWIQLLGLPSSEASSRRVRDAMSWLDQNRFIRTERLAGPLRIYLLAEDGSGLPYRHPSELHQHYVQIPRDLWIRGWIASLSGAGLAVLLILLDTRPYGEPDQRVWLSPRILRDRYSVSQETWTKGSRQLEEYGLIYVLKVPVDEEKYGLVWRRNAYYVHEERLAFPPPTN